MPRKKKERTFEKKIMHVRKSSHIPRDYTVVALFDADAQTIQYGVSVCHPTADVFCKRYGRTVAAHRALKNPVVVEDISQLLNIQVNPSGPRAKAIFRHKAESFAYFFVFEYLHLIPEFK